MPVDKVGKENCIRFVGGSHNWGKWFYPRKFATGKDYPQDNKWKPDREFEPVPDIEAELDKYEILNWDLEVRLLCKKILGCVFPSIALLLI